MNRRHFLQLAAAAALVNPLRLFAKAESTLDPWTPGTLDIHHLAYGRGNSTFLLAPDGTTLLIDAGTNEDSTELSCPQRPNANLRPGQWIAAYALRHMQPANRRELDYAILTHLHPDHLGDLGPENPPAPEGNYRLTGISDVDAVLPIRTLIDRAFPGYVYPTPQTAPYATNYIAWVRARQQRHAAVERIQPGRADQIRPTQNPAHYPQFQVRNLAANGEVWTGHGTATRATFPSLNTLAQADYPTENMCSIALRLDYGNFRYYTGGDLTSDTEDTNESWRDIETAVAQACGPVDVAVADHHAFFDAMSPNTVRSLRPQDFIIPSWYVGHPSIAPLRRMLSPALDPAPHDVFATCIMDANRSVNQLFINKLRSQNGHIIVRVAPGGESFRVIVTDNSSDEDRVLLATDPIHCQQRP
ncbi:MAG TPA: MBL fold metallo-hydrolase [Acidobacteriaceae bacterium]|nr:MBL fold metallo-hydrolase [Acidobacteriaceae bacterium]